MLLLLLWSNPNILAPIQDQRIRLLANNRSGYICVCS